MPSKIIIDSSITRNFSIDLLRVLAIFFVVLTHVTALPKDSSIIETGIVSIYAFFGQLSVPLFVIVSGYLLLHKEESYGEFFVKRIRRVVIPWLFWTVIYVFWNMYYQHILITSQIGFIKYVYRTFFSYFWFLPMICGLYILTPFLRIFVRCSKLRDIFFLIIIWFFFVSFLPIIAHYFNFSYHAIPSYVIQFLGYYLLGAFFRRIVMTKRDLSIYFILFFLLILSATYMGIARNTTTLHVLFSHTAPFIIIASSIFFLVILHFRTLFSIKASNLLIKLVTVLSSISLGIYLIHPIVMDVFLFSLKLRHVVPYSPLGIPYSAFLVFIVSSLAIFILKRIPFLKLFVV